MGAGWLRGLGMLCYVYVCTRHMLWDDARGRVIVCVHRAGHMIVKTVQVFNIYNINNV